MQPNILSGSIKLPEEKQQKQLHKQLSEFAHWMQRTKDANEIKKDKKQSVQISQLPMVF